MTILKKSLMASVVFCGLLVSGHVSAQTVTTKTVVQQQKMPNMQKINFSAFDLNEDNILSMAEVGQKLFFIFDTDGNDVIDNIEFKHREIMTIIPMEKQTTTFTDSDNDGRTDKKTYTSETFLNQSGLMRFDNNKDGLSPEEFIGHSFLEMDHNNSKVIELSEWKKAYTKMIHQPNAEQDRYN